jgi:hypothetical protein
MVSTFFKPSSTPLGNARRIEGLAARAHKPRRAATGRSVVLPTRRHEGERVAACAQRSPAGSAAGLRSISRSKIMRISVGRSGWCGPIVSSLATRSSRTCDGQRVWGAMRSAPKAIARCFMTIPRPAAETSSDRMLPPQRSSPANMKLDQNHFGSSGKCTPQRS